ncbi:MAG: histidinol-phosphatase [Treponema sp.]|nr:histidinol-phosphatase [Treponema sp.]
MRYACLHTHTTFCDGKDTVEALCQAAWEQGLSILGFSAHAPLPVECGIKTNWHLPQERLEAYVEAVQHAKAAWKDRLAIYVGLEIDYINGVCGPADHRFDTYPLDYRIGSVHYLAKPDLSYYFTVDGPATEWQDGVQELFSGDYEAAAHAYWTAIETMVKSGGFDVLGHIDLVKKNHQPWWHDQTPEGFKNDVARVIQALRKKPLVVEVNTGALNRGTMDETYPSLGILKEMARCEIPVTINADAHSTAHLKGHYDRAISVLKQSGYREIVNFQGKSGSGKNMGPLANAKGPEGWIAEVLP